MRYYLCLGLLAFCFYGSAQIAFGIVAVDSITKEVGVAGASCSFAGSPDGAAYISSDLIPGVAAMLTVGIFDEKNYENFRIQVEVGRSATSLMGWLLSHDNTGLNFHRQYALAQFFNNRIDLGAQTGEFTLPVSGEIIGPNYVIVGSSLRSDQVLVNMENGFNNASGELADKLLGALRGAKEIGADIRCTDSLVSSKSAYIRVAKPTDTEDDTYLDLNVPNTLHQVDAIDSLLNLFDVWSELTPVQTYSYDSEIKFIPNPARQQIYLVAESLTYPVDVEVYNQLGSRLFMKTLTSRFDPIDISHLDAGQMLFLNLISAGGQPTAYPLQKVLIIK